MVVISGGTSAVVRVDDFYRPMPSKQRAVLTPEEGSRLLFDVERLTREALFPLRNGLPARFRAYDWSINRLGPWREVESSALVVIEGVHAADERCRALVDLIVFVEIDPELRWQRMLARGHHDVRQIKRWSDAEDRYFTDQQIHSADLVVVGGPD